VATCGVWYMRQDWAVLSRSGFLVSLLAVVKEGLCASASLWFYIVTVLSAYSYYIIALPWRVFLGCPACIQPVFRVTRRFPAYLTVSSCIRSYLAVSSCIPLYLTVSHRLENGICPQNTLQAPGWLQGRALYSDCRALEIKKPTIKK